MSVLFRPDWKHRELVLKIGSRDFRFRTLSLYDVWSIWPHLAPLREAVTRGKPMEFALRFSALLDHVCPGLTQSEDFKSWSQTHLDALIEFYERQDWARIQVLAEDLSRDKEAPAPPSDGLTSESRFFMICMTASKACNMSVPEFVEQRFEFCADAFMGLHKAIQAEKGAGKQSAADFFMTAASLLPTEHLSSEGTERPSWIDEIERQTGKGPSVQ